MILIKYFQVVVILISYYLIKRKAHKSASKIKSHLIKYMGEKNKTEVIAAHNQPLKTFYNWKGIIPHLAFRQPYTCQECQKRGKLASSHLWFVLRLPICNAAVYVNPHLNAKPVFIPKFRPSSQSWP